MKPTEVSLGELVSVCGGGTPRKTTTEYFDGAIPWVTPKDMKSWVISDSQVHLSQLGVDSSPAKVIPAGSVLVVVRSGILKHTLPVGLTAVPVTVNQDLKALTPGHRLHAPYLGRLLRARESEVLSWVRATTADNFPIQKLLDMTVPLPPLAEQRRIAAILDQADALRAKRRQTVTLRDTLTHSLFQDMFGDLSSDTQLLGDLVVEFRYGTSAKSQHNGVPTLRIPNVIGGSLDLRDLKTVPVAAAEEARLRLRAGDLLFVRSNGNPDNVGRSAVFDSAWVRQHGHDPDGFIYASYLIRARLDLHRVHPVFLQQYLQSPRGRKQLRDRAKTSAGQFNINIDGLRSVSVPNVPLARQQMFADTAANLKRQLTPLATSAQELEGLFASLQFEVFSGSL